jgi:hypothetical protein
LAQSLNRVALTQLLPFPVDEKVQGLDPCEEILCRLGPGSQTIELTEAGKLLTVNGDPEEQTTKEPEIGRFAPGNPYRYLIPAISSEPRKRCEPVYSANINEPDIVV